MPVRPNLLPKLFMYASLAFLMTVSVACHSTDVGDKIHESKHLLRVFHHPDDHPTIITPQMSKKPTMMALAHDLDTLEQQIDLYGSVTAKNPDIWGQARLTRYREEIEQQMSSELGKFKEIISGQVSRTDQSFLQEATALSLVATQPTGFFSRPERQLVQPTTQIGNFTSAPDAPKVGSELVGGDPAFKRNDPKPAAQFKQEFEKIGLEPVEYLNQKKRYLEYLAQLRRNNEGDDTADSPGYSLNLLRIPVSLLPGKLTDKGHGAEINFTINPILSDELLPTTFRNLMMNDIIEQISFPLAKFLESPASELVTDPILRLVVRDLYDLQDVANMLQNIKLAKKEEILKNLESAELYAKEKLATQLVSQIFDQNTNQINDLIQLANENFDSLKGISAENFYNAEFNSKMKNGRWDLNATINRFEDVQKKLKQNKNQKENNEIQPQLQLSTENKCIDHLCSVIAANIKKQVAASIAMVNTLIEKLASLNVPYATGTKKQQTFPLSQALEVYGVAYPFEIAHRINFALGQKFKIQGFAHLPDVQSFLKGEVDAAYRLLSNDQNLDLWNRFVTPDLVTAIRTRNSQQLSDLRKEFRGMIVNRTGFSDKNNPDKQAEFSSTAAIAWMLLVEAALLTDRTVIDMKEATAARQLPLGNQAQWLDFYMPNPSPEARRVFNEYVKTRWPIHVFALDPVTDDQNIASSFSMRREMQFAASLAFISGRMNMNQFRRFARRLEADFETIDLNRKQVGFTHGENIFGWRFYPRFQTPEPAGTLTTIIRDHITGGPTTDELLKQRRMEPGARECVALVVMPSFVPTVEMDVSSNWFDLVHPKHKVFDMTQTMRLSHRVQMIRTKNCEIADADNFRAGDMELMVKRAEQLSARLPLAHMNSQVPIEGNLGGFELFSNSTTDLAPQLYGWYGAPGVDLNKDTTLYLVGDHFSVTQTRVLAGNQDVDPLDAKNVYLHEEVNGEKKTAQLTVPTKRMISRQLMQVTIPKTAIPTGSKTIQINVATPYGVSQELMVPVVNLNAPPPAILPADTTIVYAKKYSGESKFKTEIKGLKEQEPIWVRWPASAGAPAELKEIVFQFDYDGCPYEIKLSPMATNCFDGKPIMKHYMIDPLSIKFIAEEINAKLASVGPFNNENNPFKDPIVSGKITLVPKAGRSVTADMQIKLNFQCSIE
ncbi:MAG: hypothetical protein R3B84_18020 [Zavarzinella sp.]